MGTIEPAPEKLQHFLETAPSDSPIVMINLLRFREQADYAPEADAEPCSGTEAYQRYGAAVTPMIGKHGGRALWMGAVASTVIAPEGETWDTAVLVEYPSKQAFLEMVSSPEYQAITFHRTAGLADSRLIATTQGVSQLSE